jgi:23S rRNA (guanosine2251-2'-O)-methyltransferase
MREIIYGRSAVYETLRAARRQFFTLQIADTVKPTGRIRQILELAASRDLPVTRTPRLKLPPGDGNHQGIALEAGGYPYCDLADILERAEGKGEAPFVLVLDSLQDPQNFGSLLRTAEGVGAHGVIIPLARTVEVTPAVVNASAGASEHLLIAQSNLSQAIDSFKQVDMWIVGLDQHGEPLSPLSDRHLGGALGLVVGSEGEGLHDLIQRKCDTLLRLPMRGNVESLNAAVAGSVALYLAYLTRQTSNGTHGTQQSTAGARTPPPRTDDRKSSTGNPNRRLSMDVEFNLIREVPQGRPNVAVLHLNGWLDAQSEDALVEAVRKARSEGAEYVVLDLAGVGTITSAGIRAIQKSFGILTPKEATIIGHLKLCNAAPQVYDVLSITGVLVSVPMYESLDIAIESSGR